MAKKTAQSKYIKPAKIPKPPEVPKDLQDLWGAVEATATAFNTMQAGSYTHKYLTTLQASLGFLAKLHEQTIESALKHKNARLIPELAKVLDERNKPTNPEGMTGSPTVVPEQPTAEVQ